MSHDLHALIGVVAFLVAITVLARACADEGLFQAWGGAVSRASVGSPRRGFLLAAALAIAVTATLTLDATVVLLTPVLLAAGFARRGALLSVRLANTASTLLPISNLTNLLVFTASGLSFVRFAWLMLPVWLVGVVAEVAIVRWWCRRDPVDVEAPQERVTAPLLPALVVVAVLVAIAAGATPWICGGLGAIAVGAYALLRRTTRWRDLLEAANLPLAVVVVVWGGLVIWLSTTAVGDWVDGLVPSTQSWWAVVVTALLAMVAANVVNNLPATLLLLPAAVTVGPVAVLAVLVGVNVGANLTAVGSLANILWRRSGGSRHVSWAEFHRLGLLTTPPLVVACATVLWAWARLVG